MRVKVMAIAGLTATVVALAIVFFVAVVSTNRLVCEGEPGYRFAGSVQGFV